MVFLVRENQKWATESVYRAMAGDPRFRPVVATSAHRSRRRPERSSLRVGLADNERYFVQRGILSQAVHRGHRFLELESLEPDVLFYDQPYGLPLLHRPARLRRSALVCYSPYGFGFYLMAGSKQRVDNGLLASAWRVFLAPRTLVQEVDAHLALQENVSLVGDPKADELLEAIRMAETTQREHAGRRTVIWAPHHSVSRRHHNRLATFDWSAAAVLRLVQAHTSITWVLKAHPRLWQSLVDHGIMTREAIGEFQAQWERLPNTRTHSEGGYAGLFLDAGAMVTDSGSFLLEFGLIGRPIIHLTSAVDPRADARFSTVGRELIGELYTARNPEELDAHFEEVVVNGRDPRRERRMTTRALSTFCDAPPAGPAIADTIARTLLDP